MNPVPFEIEEPFWSHVEQLRRTAISIMIVIAIGFVCCLTCYRPLFQALTYPIIKMEESKAVKAETLTTKHLVNRSDEPQKIIFSDVIVHLEPGEETTIQTRENPSLAILSPIDGMSTTLQVCFWSSLVLTAPFWMVFLFQFIGPALHKHDQNRVPFIIFTIATALAIGTVFGFTILLPIANHYLYAFNTAIGTNVWTVSHYLSYTVLLLTSSVLAFETAAVLMLLVCFDKISAKTLIRHRRVMVVCFFFASAVLTPPDIISQIMLALPLTLLYEAAILIAKWRSKQRKKVVFQ